MAQQEPGTPAIWTDQSDYPWDSVVTIYGANFAVSQVDLSVLVPTGTVDSWTVSVTNGGFTTTYQLLTTSGTYLVAATDPATGEVLARTQFYDPLPTPPGSYGSTSISSSFTSSPPTRDGRLAPFSGSYVDGGSTPWPFTAANEWSDAAKFGMFSTSTQPPWTSTANAMFFPPIGWATLTIPPSGPAAPSSPPWAPSWLFIMNDATNLYLLGEVNAGGDKACFECPGGSGPSDFMAFFFDTNHDTKADKTYSWTFAYTTPPSANNLQGDVYAINCPQVASSTNGVAAGSCPSPTVYEAIIPLSDLGCTSGVSCSVGLWVDSHASPACKTDPPCQYTPPVSSSLSTTPSPSSAVTVGTSIYDKAELTLSAGAGTPSGTVDFLLYAGTCSAVTGSALYTDSATVGSSNNGATVEYDSGSFSTSSLSSGNYVWLVRYSGGGGWPAAPTSGTLLNGDNYDCEPFILYTPSTVTTTTTTTLTTTTITTTTETTSTTETTTETTTTTTTATTTTSTTETTTQTTTTTSTITSTEPGSTTTSTTTVTITSTTSTTTGNSVPEFPLPQVSSFLVLAVSMLLLVGLRRLQHVGAPPGNSA